MSEFIKYPSIEQFRNIVKEVKYLAGTDHPLPVLEFKGTVKAHGTNAAICYDTNTEELWAQSRNNIITIENDNIGFANYVEDNKKILKNKFIDLILTHKMEGIITIFGEWCGGNIQKNVAICQLEKMFIAFAIKYNDEWLVLNKKLNIPSIRYFNINQFPTIVININFSNPQDSVNTLVAITEEVEKECPIGKYFGVSGIGEGIVWEGSYLGKNLRFKVKGEKHSSSKVKKLVEVDTEKLNSINEFVEYVITDSRMNQSIEQVFIMENTDPDIKAMGSVIKWVMGDVNKEEADTLANNNLTMKDITKPAVTEIRNWFIKYLDTNL